MFNNNNVQSDLWQNSVLRLTVAGCASATALCAIANAQFSGNTTAPLTLRSDYFGYAASVSPRVGFTDNINLASEGAREEEYSFSTLLNLSAIASKPRVTGVFLGDIDLSYLANQDEFVVNQNVGAAATFTGVDNWLYLDVAGSSQRQLLGDNARFSNSLNSARNQRANVHSYSVSPYLHHRMADNSAYELRYRFSQTFIDDSDTDANPFDGDLLNDSQTHEVLASYESGNLFERVKFRTGVYGNRTKEDGTDLILVDPVTGAALLDPSTGAPIGQFFEYEQGSAFAEAQVALSDNFALSGAVGYDEIDTDLAAEIFFDDEDLSGVFWRAGFSARPSRRTNIRLEYGERYGDDFIDASVFYELSSRFLFSASASRTFQTRAESNLSLFRSASRQILEFADRLREGQELSPREVVERTNQFAGGYGDRSQTIGLGTTNAANAALTAQYDRTQFTGAAFYSDTDFGFRENTSFGLSLNVDRRLSRRLTGYGNFTWRSTDTTVDTSTCESNPTFFGLDPSAPMFDPMTACATLAGDNGKTNTLIGSIGASYRLVENVSAFAEYSHAERFSENAALEYGENSILAGITLEF
ncbi:MAG: hypothetical protein AAGB02_02165 [Pseudomonadota bacterium]